jgi:uncharacterized protein (TIGR00369 family)
VENTSDPWALRLHLTEAEVSAFLDSAFPASVRPLLGEIDSLTLNRLRMRLDPDNSMKRPGEIVAGPALMAFVDVAAYAAIAAHLGPQAMALTSTLSISFLRACQFERIFADVSILKLGRRLATLDVRLWQWSEDRLIAQATVGYALP